MGYDLTMALLIDTCTDILWEFPKGNYLNIFCSVTPVFSYCVINNGKPSSKTRFIAGIYFVECFFKE